MAEAIAIGMLRVSRSDRSCTGRPKAGPAMISIIPRQLHPIQKLLKSPASRVLVRSPRSLNAGFLAPHTHTHSRTKSKCSSLAPQLSWTRRQAGHTTHLLLPPSRLCSLPDQPLVPGKPCLQTSTKNSTETTSGRSDLPVIRRDKERRVLL